MKKKIKPHMDTYNTIYPFTLVVANEAVTLKEINKHFMWSDGCDILENEIDGGCCAITLTVVRRDTRNRIILVKFNRHDGEPKTKAEETNDFWKLSVHEAGHVILTAYNLIEDSIAKKSQQQEPFCYFIEWVAARIYETISKK